MVDPNTEASHPGGLALSLAKLRALQPQLFAEDRPQDADHRRQWLQLITEQLQSGDSRAAVVVDASKAIVAAYTDELDCVVLLQFDPRIAQADEWRVGTRLLSVNLYMPKAKGIAADLVPGPNQLDNWGNFRPVIADLLTDDLRRLAQAKEAIGEDEWLRAQRMGEKAMANRAFKPRDGRPLMCGTPTVDTGLESTMPVKRATAVTAGAASAGAAATRSSRTRRPVTPVSQLDVKALVVALVCFAIAGVGISRLGDVSGSSTVVTWGCIVFFGAVGLVYGSVFYKRLFPSAA